MSSDSENPGPSEPSDFPGAGEESEYPDFHRSTRMPLDAVVRLHFEGTVAYQNGFGANVSATGMYVKHPDPPPLGTRLVFELVLGDERKPVQGAGFVAWAREKYEGPGRPAGIGIQFTEIDALSRQHIAEALFAYLETQLGDELAESQDVVDLVATSSTHTAIDFGSFGRSDESAAATPVSKTITPASPLPPIAPISAATTTRLGEEIDADASAAPVASPFKLYDGASEAGSRTANGGLFTAEVPPDNLPEIRSAASRPAKSRWPAVVIGVVIAVGAFAAWWFLAGPGSIGDAAVRSPSPAAQATEPAPSRPALSGEPGTDATLAETIGAAGVKAPEPLPVGAKTAEPSEETAEPGEVTAEPGEETAEPGEEPAVAPDAAPAGAEPAPTDTAAEPLTTSEAATTAPKPEAPPAAAPTTAAAADPVPQLTRVTAITWEESNGLTVVALTGDGAFPAGSYKWNEIRDANPRVLLRLTGMSAGFGKTLLAAGTPELEKVRIGYHEKPAGNELHVVLDLTSAAVKVESVAASGNQLLVRLTKQ